MNLDEVLDAITDEQIEQYEYFRTLVRIKGEKDLIYALTVLISRCSQVATAYLIEMCKNSAYENIKPRVKLVSHCIAFGGFVSERINQFIICGSRTKFEYQHVINLLLSSDYPEVNNIMVYNVFHYSFIPFRDRDPHKDRSELYKPHQYDLFRHGMTIENTFVFDLLMVML